MVDCSKGLDPNGTEKSNIPSGTAPVISAISAAQVTTTTAFIHWTTDVASTSLVNFGNSSSYGQQKVTSGNATSHSVFLSGLTPSALIHFQVISINASGGASQSSDNTFNTPAVTNVPVCISPWVENLETAPSLVGNLSSPADPSMVFGISPGDGLVVQYFLNSSSQWKSWELAPSGQSSNAGLPAISSITSTESSGLIDVYGIRADTGQVNQWEWSSTSGAWVNSNLSVSGSAGNLGPGLSQIFAMDSNNVFGLRKDTGHLNQWYRAAGTQTWNNHDLTVTANAQNTGPSLVAISATESSGVYEIFGIRSDNGHVNQWQWSNSNWINQDLAVTANPSAAVPAYSAISVAPENGTQNVFGIRSDNNNYLNQWQWVPAHTTNGQPVAAAWSNYDFAGPALSAISAVDANDVFGIRADTGALIEWQYNSAQAKWVEIEFCGQPLWSIAAANSATVFGINSNTGTPILWQQ